MLQLFRTSPGLIISVALLGGGAVVCTLLGFLMARSGVSLRPIYWFAGFFALIGVPQFVGHFYLALKTTKAEAPRAAALERIASDRSPAAPRTNPSDADQAATGVQPSGAPVDAADAKALFGPDADPQLIIDARLMSGDAFAMAEFARFAPLPNGDTVVLAQFMSSSAAEKAWVAYLRVSGLNQLGGKGDSQRGYAVTRPVGDRAYVLHFGTMVGIWTGKDDAAIRARMAAGGFEVPRRAPLEQGAVGIPVAVGSSAISTPQPTGPKPGATSPLRLALIAAGLAVYLLIVVLYFFKGVAWAGTARAKPGVSLLAANDLAARLEAINALDVPFHIERGTQPDEFFATWRYADAKWIDLARARGLRRTFRIRLRLDETTRTVRATDYTASFDWSAGRGGASLDWKAGVGIVFFQYEHQRVFGLQLDDQGRFKPELNYAYTFNLNEMKSPIIEAVTRAGWNWRPTVWQGPTWLRWLTE
jgi:hypothetical protein